ncbi:MAG TPA: 7TM-DISM domain-containing protein [Ramlibacter sp.]|uniref:7TM-DISM domain-containing protein n=1 Tax=Ramlibacter sp. TaxID=1917967 RepID=UPI002C101918|nr:7TM-DISM domain-containing protein [Ramlibacter sp.]HVZ46860.1 7TM-DISM domain-containing protein [Ramlibacter sp.]
MSWVCLIGVLLWFPLAAWADAPVMQLSPSVPQQPLAEAMSVAILPISQAVAQAADPDALWNAPVAITTDWSANRWEVRPGERVVGRIVLQSARQSDVWVVEASDATVDRVQLWYREAGKPWRSAEAGDRVPLARWPFFGQFPAFALTLTEAPLQVMVVVENAQPEAVPIWLRTESAFVQARLLQANFAGIAMGLGLMGAVMCLVAAITYRRRASWMLFAYATWSLATVACNTGYTAIWFTPQWPQFNDASKDFTLVVMGALLVTLIAESLDRLDALAIKRWAVIVTLLAGLGYAFVHVLALPGSLRPLVLAYWETLCFLAGAILCLVSWLRGGRYLVLPAAAVVLFGVAMALQYDAFDLSSGFDATSLAASLALFASAQVLRHGVFIRERYGRDVLGRAAIAANRDPLTALLSYPGLQHAYESARLKEGAGRGPVALVVFSLPRFDDCSIDHGFVLTERAVVRFAAALQQVLGNDWAIGRLSKTRFAALANTRGSQDELVQCATRILSQCARIDDTLSPVNDFDLRIVCAIRGKAVPFRDVLREMEEAAQAMEGNKRIATV